MEHPVELKDTVRVGEQIYVTAVLGKLSAADIADAAEAAEQLRITPKGPLLVTSPARLTRERVSRQVKRLVTADGKEYPGPLTAVLLKAISADDYERLIDEIDRLDEASARAVEKVGHAGRDGGAGETP